MDASKSQNYLQSMPGMMNGMKGFFSREHIHLWCDEDLQLPTLSGASSSSDCSLRLWETAALSDGVSVWPGLGVLGLLENLDTETVLPRAQWSSNGGGDSGPRASYANEDIVGLLLIKMFPQGCSIHRLIKNVIADVIKRCVMIHDNNYAAGKTSAHDLRTVHDMGKSLSGLITDETWQTQRFHAAIHQNMHVWSDDWICLFTYLGEVSALVTGWRERLMVPSRAPAYRSILSQWVLFVNDGVLKSPNIIARISFDWIAVIQYDSCSYRSVPLGRNDQSGPSPKAWGSEIKKKWRSLCNI